MNVICLDVIHVSQTSLITHGKIDTMTSSCDVINNCLFYLKILKNDTKIGERNILLFITVSKMFDNGNICH